MRKGDSDTEAYGNRREADGKNKTREVKETNKNPQIGPKKRI